ncbi:hypothetical protein SANTM175S_04598 [Streptomyces antimycoticus]
MYNGSVLAEVLRAGRELGGPGPARGGVLAGLRKTQVMTSVLVPQGVRAMLPAIISQLVVALKDTSLGFVITYEELLFQLQQLAGNIVVNDDNPYVPVIIVGGAIYIAMCLALSALATWIERRGRRAKTGIRVADAGQPPAGGRRARRRRPLHGLRPGRTRRQDGLRGRPAGPGGASRRGAVRGAAERAVRVRGRGPGRECGQGCTGGGERAAVVRDRPTRPRRGALGRALRFVSGRAGQSGARGPRPHARPASGRAVRVRACVAPGGAPVRLTFLSGT